MAARVSQVAVAVLTQPTTQRARVSQLAVEVLYPSDLPPAPAGAVTQRWDGSAWQPATVRRWDGSAWQPATLKRWTGSTWG
jgi:hypothetical protein